MLRTRTEGCLLRERRRAQLRMPVTTMLQADETVAWREHRARLVRFVRPRVEDDDAAEDIVQEVLLRAFARQDTLRDAERISAWLLGITRNAIVDHYRARRPREALPEDLIAAEPETDTLTELAGCVAPLVDALPEPYRAALALADLQGLTQRETAVRLGITLSGAKSRVQRGRVRLREMLLRCCRMEMDHRGVPMDFEPARPCACAPGGAA